MYKLDVRTNWTQVADNESAVIQGMLSNSKCDLSSPDNACTFFIVAPPVGGSGEAIVREYGLVETNAETVIGLVKEGLRARIAAQYADAKVDMSFDGDYNCKTAQWAKLWALWKYNDTEALATIVNADAYVIGADDVVYLLQDSITFQTQIAASRGLPEGFQPTAPYVPIVAGKALGGDYVSPPVPCGTTVVIGSDLGGGALPGLVDVNAIEQGKSSSWTWAAIGVGILAAGGAAYALLRRK